MAILPINGYCVGSKNIQPTHFKSRTCNNEECDFKCKKSYTDSELVTVPVALLLTALGPINNVQASNNIFEEYNNKTELKEENNSKINKDKDYNYSDYHNSDITSQYSNIDSKDIVLIRKAKVIDNYDGSETGAFILYTRIYNSGNNNVDNIYLSIDDDNKGNSPSRITKLIHHVPDEGKPFYGVSTVKHIKRKDRELIINREYVIDGVSAQKIKRLITNNDSEYTNVTNVKLYNTNSKDLERMSVYTSNGM